MKSEAARAGALLAAALAMFVIAYQASSDIFLSFGPNDYPYVSGFREDFEIDEPTLIHWSRQRGRIQLPFILPGGRFSISFRYKRHTRLPADIRLFVGGDQVDRFTAPQQDFKVRSIVVETNPSPWSPLEIAILAQSQDPRPLGLAMDWLQIRPSGPVLPTPKALAYLLGLVAGLYLFPRLIGFSPRACLALGFSGALLLSLAAVFHKMAPIHAATILGLRTHLAALLVLAVVRLLGRRADSAFARPEARWALLAFYLGTMVRLLGLFHPEFFYPDVRTHSKFVSLIWTEGLVGVFSDYINYQHQHLLGLQLVGDQWLAFPYPPLLYLTIYPLSLLRLPVEDWMKIVPTVLVGVESLVVYAFVCRLGGSGRAAAAAAWFHIAAPLVAFRLTVASYAALFGHFWDTLVVGYLLYFYQKMNRVTVALGLAALVAVSILSYAGSALVLGLFIPAFSLAILLQRKDPGDFGKASATALAALAGAMLAVGLFYVQYVPELLPGGIRQATATGSQATLIDLQVTPMAGLAMTIHRLNLFYGPFFGLLIFVALPWVRKTFSHRLTFPLGFATLFAFIGLNFLRSGLGDTNIFQFTKDDLVLLPLAAIVLGALFDRLAARSRVGRIAAYGILVGWVGWGCVALARDVRSRFIRPDYPPPVARLVSPPATPALPNRREPEHWQRAQGPSQRRSDSL
jgi:hypothetical protein